MTAQFLYNALIHLFCISPFISYFLWKEKKKSLQLLAILLIILIADNFCIYAIPKLIVINSAFNWIGKISTLLIAVIIIFLLKQTKKDLGLTTQYEKNTLKPIVITFFIIAFILNGITYITDGFKGVKLEPILFQATIPGITEELMYRGILLGLLNSVIAKKVFIFNVQVGWGGIISAILFGLAHGLIFDKNLNIYFNMAALVFTGLLGLVFTWSREKSGSIIPGILGHNLINTLSTF